MNHPAFRSPARPFFFQNWQEPLLCLAFAAIALVGTTPGAHSETDPTQGRLITSEAIAVNPVSLNVYAVNEPDDSVSVLEERTGSTHSVKVGKGPVSLAVNPVTNRIYVVNAGSDSISVIDGRNDTVMATIRERSGSHPYVLAVDDKANKVYITNTYSDALTVIDGATNAASTLKTGSADGIAIDPRTHTIFLMSYEDPNIRLVNPATGAIAKIDVGPHLWGMVFDQALKTLYVAHTLDNNVVALNEKNYALTVIPVGAIPCALAINPVTQRLYVVNYRSRTLSVIRAGSGKTVATLPVGKNPQAVAVDSRHNVIYVANVHENNVTVIDGARDAILETRPAGRNPYALAVAAGTGNAFAADDGEPPIFPLVSRGTTPRRPQGGGNPLRP